MRDRVAENTGSAAGVAFPDMLDVFAELGTGLRRERRLEGSGRPQGPQTHKSPDFTAPLA